MAKTYTVLKLTNSTSVSNYTSASNEVKGVILRAGYRGYGTAGTMITDSLFATHYNGFYGKIPVGVYFTSQAITQLEAEEEVGYLYNLIKHKDIKFPIYVESCYSSSPDRSGRADGLTRIDRTNIIKVFCTKFKQLGYRVGIIATDDFLQNNLKVLDFDDDYSIIVNDINDPSYYTEYDAKKLTNTGSISGINTKVELYTFVKDVAGWTEEEIIDISTLDVEIEYDSIVYTGEYFYPKITIEGLVEDRDFTTEYSTNKNAGTGNVLVRGINNYKGIVSKTFTIEKCNINTKTAELIPPSFIYTGSQCCPNVEIEGLMEYVDFSVTYGTNINIGKGTVRVEGVSNFYGFFIMDFDILPKDINDIPGYVTPESYAYNGRPQEPLIFIDDLERDTDFTVEYEDNIDPGTAKAIATGIGNYTGTRIFEFSILINDVSLLDPILEYDTIVYNKQPNKPKVTIDGLVEDVDFSVDYLNNINAGTATARIRGIGDFTGTNRKTFTITKRDISTLTITMDKESYPYIGTEVRPRLTIETNPQEGVDYATTYTNNIDPGTATVKISGKNNYTGGVTLTYPITYVNILDCTAAWGKKSEKTPYWIGIDGPFKLYSENVLLNENEDYVIENKISTTYEDYTYIQLVVTGVNGIVGDTEYKFKAIEKEPITPVPPGPDVPPDDRPDDGTYNFGDIDEHDETAVGNYDFEDIDEGVSEESVAIPDGDYDFNKFCYDDEDMERDDIRFAEGTEYILKDIDFYPCYCSKVPFDTRSGSYLVYKQKAANGRIRMTKSNRAVNNPVRCDGWVNKDDIIALIEFTEGLYVKVIGDIYQYPNGTGYRIAKDGETMYISKKLEATYSHRYGLSTTNATSLIGYAEESQLSRIDEE